MTILPPIKEGFSRWIDTVAGTVSRLLDRLRSDHHVQVIEDAPDTFTLRMADGDGKSRASSLPDRQIRVADGALADPLPADWAKMLRGSRAEIVLRPSRFLF